MTCNQTRTSRVQLLTAVAAVASMLCFSGCSDYIPEKATELQARSILNNLSRVQPVPDPNVPVPEVYKAPPKIIEQNVGGITEYKLFYFCRHHTADKLQGIVQAQFAATLFGKKDQETTPKDYTVTSNPATNQLIVRCPNQQDVESVLDLLKATDVPPIQVKIDCMISELYADLTMDKEVTLEIENFLGESIAMGGKVENGELLPAFPGAALREPARDKFGLKIGFGHQLGVPGHQFRALVDLLISRGYLKILMNPSLEVINGQSAHIQTKEHVPLQTISIRGSLDSFLETRTEYYDIIDSLEITPHVFADGYIGLETEAKISAKLTPEGIVQRPIVTERTISNKENRIRHGESLVIGGIRKSEKRDVIRGVPVLKDIPLIGALFSGRDFEERAKEVIFILTPTISTGGVPNKEMVESIREMHEDPVPYEELHKTILDPFGFDTRERERQRQLLDAEEARMAAEAEKARARMQVRRAEDQAKQAREQTARTREQLEDLRAQAEQAKLEAERIKAEAEKLTAEAAKARAEADKAAAEAAKARQEADAVKSGDETAPAPEGGQEPAPEKAPEPTGPSSEEPAGEAKPAEEPSASTAKPSESKSEPAAVAATPPQAEAETENSSGDTEKPVLGSDRVVVESPAEPPVPEPEAPTAAAADSEKATGQGAQGSEKIEISGETLWRNWITLYGGILTGEKYPVMALEKGQDAPSKGDEPNSEADMPKPPDPVIRAFKEVTARI